MRHFGPTDRDNRTGQSGPPSKLVTNIPIRPNRNGPFHLIYQPKFPKFWVEWKAPFEYRIFSVLPPPAVFISGSRLHVVTLVIFFLPFSLSQAIVQSGFVKHRLKSLSLLTCPECLNGLRDNASPIYLFFTHVQKNSPTRPICLVTGRFAASSSRFVAIDFLHKTVLKKLRMNYKRVILRS